MGFIGPGSTFDAAAFEALDASGVLDHVLGDERFGRVSVVSSFGAESAVLLHMVAAVDSNAPVLFVDTGKLFGETLRYAEKLRTLLGLKDLRVLRADADAIAQVDPKGDLWREDADACCAARKVSPLNQALDGFDTWITGRKRFQSHSRVALPKAEVIDGRVKINPLAEWSRAQVDDYFSDHHLPRHPLEADGFLSIGCFTCTDRVQPGEDARAGRWRGLGKTECGIHLPAATVGGRLPAR